MAFGRLGPQRRVGFLDEARGLCLVLMIVYHGAYDLVYLFGWNIPAFHWPLIEALQHIFAGMFILISGICCRFSRNNIKRGLQALAVGLAMTLFTLFFMREQAILFGILHFLGCAMVLFGLLKPLLDLLPPFWGLLATGVLFVFFWGLPAGYLGIPGVFSLTLPRFPYELGVLFPLGFAGPGFFSADYFPLLPWLFLFFAGSYLGLAFTESIMPDSFYRKRVPLLGAIGRKSLLVYVLHQPVVYAFLFLVDLAVGSIKGLLR